MKGMVTIEYDPATGKTTIQANTQDEIVLLGILTQAQLVIAQKQWKRAQDTRIDIPVPSISLT